MNLTNIIDIDTPFITNKGELYTLNLLDSNLKLELNSHEYHELKKAIVASYELTENSNHWIQQRVKTVLKAHRAAFDFLVNEGYFSERFCITDKSFDKKHFNRLDMTIEDFLHKYMYSVKGFPVATREFFDFLNRKIGNKTEIGIKDGESQLNNWTNLNHNFKSLTEEEKKKRYKLEPFCVSNASVFIGFVRPETTVQNILKIKNGSITFEVTGDDVLRLYKLFLTEEEFKLHEQGIEIWKLSDDIIKANNIFFDNLETIGFDKKWAEFKSDEDLNKERLSDIMMEYDQALISIDSLSSYISNG
ncbi:hypothetical protein BS028_15795 [Vibrio parahaemolyticus]|nr:hypothetical protein [Vibrio parahaemolyticus]